MKKINGGSLSQQSLSDIRLGADKVEIKTKTELAEFLKNQKDGGALAIVEELQLVDDLVNQNQKTKRDIAEKQKLLKARKRTFSDWVIHYMVAYKTKKLMSEHFAVTWKPKSVTGFRASKIVIKER